MAETDGEVRIKVNLDTEEIDEDMQKLEDKLSKQNSALQRQSVIVERLTARYESLYEKAIQSATPTIESEKILSQINDVEIKYKELQDLYNTSKLEPNIDEAKLQQILLDLETLDKKLIDLRKRYQEAQFSPDMQNKLRVLGKEIDLAVAKEERLTDEVRNTKKAMNDLSQAKVSENIDKTAKSLERMSEKLKNIGSSKGLFESVGQSIGGIGRRIMRLASSAFVFNVISAGFREMSKGIQSLISQDNSLSISLARIRANLVTAFYPIYQAVLPAIRALGQALSWVTGQVASFIAMLTGTSVKANQQGAKDMMIKTQGLEKEAKGYQKVGKSAKKASHELASFDKINVLNIDKDQPLSDNSNNNIEPVVPKIDGFSQELKGINLAPLDKLVDKFRELSKIFQKGFNAGFIDKNMGQIYDNILRIGTAMKDIFDNPQITEGFNRALNSVIYNLGVVMGSISSVGVTIGRLITGGIATFLEQSKETIQNQLLRLFDITDRVSKLFGNFAKAFANIFSAFGSEQAINTVANLLSSVEVLFVNFKINMLDIFVTIGENLVKPFTDSQNEIKAILEEDLKSAEKFSDGIKNICDNLGKSMNSITEKSIKPAIQVIGKIWNDVFGMIVKAWNTYISPVLQKMGDKFQTVVNERIKPALERITTSFNKIVEHVLPLIQRLWNFIKPFVNWLIESAFDKISSEMWVVFDTVANVLADVVDLIASVRQTTEKFIGMIVAILRGDWKKAWESAGDVVNSMANIAKSAINIVGSVINGLINALISGINVAIRAINRIHFDLPDWLGGGHFGLNIPEIPKGWGNIPRLSQGAVLEGGNPFLAWLGDQPKGQTNIETPLKTMVEAFNQALRQNRINEVGNVTIEASGDVGKLISFLDFKLKQENQRIGNNLVTGDVWI